VPRLRAALTYSNVMASIAVFVAFGGSSYAALKLSRNSVGASQIRPRAVASSELRTNAVSSRSIRDRSVSPQDLSAQSLTALKGQVGPQGPQGPSGVTLRATIDSVGVVHAGSGRPMGSTSGSRLVGFDRSLAGCVPVASLARIEGGEISDPGAQRLIVALEGDAVRVSTFDRDGNPARLPFNLIVAC
jgi:hypothetical protein